MGANCCIAAKEKPQPSLASVEVSGYRIRHSPSWSFRWDNRTHIEDIMENNAVFSNHSSGNIQPYLKSGSVAPAEGDNSGDRRYDVFSRVKGQKSEKKMEASKLSKVDPREEQSTEKNLTPKANSHISLDAVTIASEIKTPESFPSTPPQESKAEPEEPSSSVNHSNLTGKACQTPGHQPYSQITHANALSLETFIENSSAERRPSSSMLSSDSNDLFAALSHCESSNGLSTRTPSELVVTSQRDGWSVDNESADSVASKLSGSNTSHPTFSPDQGVCKLCSRLLKERSSWNGHELVIVAVLFCGHAYHANCLDSITAESEKYDPPCPVCTYGESCARDLFGKLDSKIKNKTSKNIATNDLAQSSKNQKKSKGPRLGISSSMKESFSQPFLRRHFSTGSRPPRSVLGSEPTRKKVFWSRRWRE
ncbi:hypothetical protein QOZ80_1AG0004840 [Eleusine coracana subsp. coracana]|nr:hypothetical protein QOZ80_1AG0004840 [Eleusine coracana subsp. coracana]